jgi:hypothetical protein
MYAYQCNGVIVDHKTQLLSPLMKQQTPSVPYISTMNKVQIAEKYYTCASCKSINGFEIGELLKSSLLGSKE